MLIPFLPTFITPLPLHILHLRFKCDILSHNLHHIKAMIHLKTPIQLYRLYHIVPCADPHLKPIGVAYLVSYCLYGINEILHSVVCCIGLDSLLSYFTCLTKVRIYVAVLLFCYLNLFSKLIYNTLSIYNNV